MLPIFRCFLLMLLIGAGCTRYTPPSIQPTPPISPSPVAQYPLPIEPALPQSSDQQIILLLPLTGKLAVAGAAIRDGFIAAQQQANTAITVEVIDTQQVQPISAAYQQAVAKGARIIVGPLEKGAVAELAQQHLPVITLALNQVPSAYNPQLYQFGLSPLDEARQAAERAASEGYREVLSIIPTGEWGDGVAQAFQQRWTELGGRVKHSLRFRLQDNLADKIKATLGISGNSHWVALKDRQQDFDVIFLAAPPAIARQIKPLLKFYYAGHIPIYATSFVYTGTPQPLQDRDLNDINFCDIPWVLEKQPLAAQLAQQDPHNFAQNSRLYALGIDAYRLALQLQDLQDATGAYLQGVTGKLYLAPQQQVVRQLPWAKFQNGQPVIMAQ